MWRISSRGENIVRNHKLKFRDDGSFNIIQFTDIHFVDGMSQEDLKTCAVIDNVLKNVDADLVVLTGDIVYGEKNKELLLKTVKLMDSYNIPWTFVFGNHDAEWGSSKEELSQVTDQSKNCIFERGDSDISGVGNHILNIYRSDKDTLAWSLFLLDSGSYNPNKNVGGYDFIKRDQINWYVKQSRNIQDQYGKVPALAFFHIPLPEYLYAWYIDDCYGEKREEVCCPKQNSGLFSAMLEMGNVKGVFVGHDHLNDYYTDLFGIKLCYGRATGYNTYGHEDFKKGARVIKLDQDKVSFDSFIILEDGQKIQQTTKTNEHNFKII